MPMKKCLLISLLVSFPAFAQNVVTNPAGSQNIVQPVNTSFSANNVAGIRYVVTDYNWSQAPSSPSTIVVGSNTVTLSPCPKGLNGSDTDHYVYIATTGMAEAAKITGGTCTSGAAIGTIIFTATQTHSAGYTVQSASGGIKEASVDARFAPTNPTGTVQSGNVIVPPGYQAAIYAPLYIEASDQTIDFTTSIVECNMVNLPCIKLGDDTNSNAYTNIEVRNLRCRAMVASTGACLEDNANSSRIIKLTTRNAVTGGYFGSLVRIDNDQAAVIDGVDSSLGTWSTCSSSFCSVAIYGPGPFATNAGVLWVKNANLSLNCTANGIDNQDGNTLHVQDSVIQAFPEFAVRTGTARGGFGPTLGTNVYMEAGGCNNPIYNAVVQSGWIVEGRELKLAGGEPASAVLPIFTNNASGSTEYDYYVVLHNSSLAANSAPLYVGKSTVNSGTVTSITVVWPGTSFYSNVNTFDLLRVTGAFLNHGTAPYASICDGVGTDGKCAVATGISAATACTATLCTFTDANAALGAYTINTGYWPLITYWPATVFLGSNGDTTNVQSGPSTYSGEPVAA